MRLKGGAAVPIQLFYTPSGKKTSANEAATHPDHRSELMNTRAENCLMQGG